MKILLIHWGNNGGGPKFAFSMARALASDSKIELTCSISKRVDNYGSWSALQDVPLLTVRTYKSVIGAIAFLPLAFLQSVKLRRLIKRAGIKAVYSPMYSLWQSLFISVWLPRDVLMYSSVHDWEQHDGDQSFISEFVQRIERRRADTLVAYSRHVAEQISRESCKNVIELWHGVDTPEHGALIRQIKNKNNVVVGFFGRILPYKGLDLFEASVRTINTPDLLVRGKIFGSGDFQFGLPDSTEFIDFINKWATEDEIEIFFDEIDILLLPYKESSQSGVVALSLSHGVPVVTTPAGGLKEQIIASNAGLVARDFTSEAVSMEILRLIQNPNLYSKLSANGLSSGSGSLSWESVADTLVNHWRSNLGDK
jgi:glycosyltransferase involved in cell wall biosynthesis